MWKRNWFLSIFMIVTTLCVCAFGAYAQGTSGDHSQKTYKKKKPLWVPPKNIATYIKNTKGQKRVIVIYATWCPACRIKIPFLMEMEQKKPGSVIAISVDEDYRLYKRFYDQYEYVPFPLIVNKGSSWELAKALKPFGGKAWKGIPYFMLINENNKIIGQGSYRKKGIAWFLLGVQESKAYADK